MESFPVVPLASKESYDMIVKYRTTIGICLETTITTTDFSGL